MVCHNSAGTVTRVGEMIQHLLNPTAYEDMEAKIHSRFQSSSEVFSVSDLSFCIPGTSTPVVQNLSFEVPIGKSLLIMGPSGGITNKDPFINKNKDVEKALFCEC
jgi:ABC-type uncharacterized transport system fused permease/ATPase subunit